MVKSCKQCGIKFDKPKRLGDSLWTKRQFCNRVCSDKARKGVLKTCHQEVICKVCKKDFTVPQYRIDPMYCSRLCQNRDKKGPTAPRWKGGVVLIVPCMDCGTREKGSVSKRCKQCSDKLRSGENNPAWKGGKSKCSDCGIEVAYQSTTCNACQGARMSGPSHFNWISDRTKLAKRQERNDSAYQNWRKQVWLRDNFTCKIANPDCEGHIEAHHILTWRDYSELRYEVNNGITLCHAHHPRKRAEEKRLIPTFQELVSVSSDSFCQ